MIGLTSEQIKEIAEQLDCGFRCFWNSENNDLIFVPDLSRYPDIDASAWKAENNLLKKHRDKFKEIESLDTNDSFQIMLEFVEQLPDTVSLKNTLTNALNNKKPFRHFKFIIDNSGEYRQKWFDFKGEWLQNWVEERVNDLKSLSEEDNL